MNILLAHQGRMAKFGYRMGMMQVTGAYHQELLVLLLQLTQKT